MTITITIPDDQAAALDVYRQSQVVWDISTDPPAYRAQWPSVAAMLTEPVARRMADILSLPAYTPASLRVTLNQSQAHADSFASSITPTVEGTI